MKSPLSLRLSFLFFFLFSRLDLLPEKCGIFDDDGESGLVASHFTRGKKFNDERGAIVQYFERSQFHAQAIRRGEKRERESEVPDNVSLSGH